MSTQCAPNGRFANSKGLGPYVFFSVQTVGIRLSIQKVNGNPMKVIPKIDAIRYHTPPSHHPMTRK